MDEDKDVWLAVGGDGLCVRVCVNANVKSEWARESSFGDTKKGKLSGTNWTIRKEGRREGRMGGWSQTDNESILLNLKNNEGGGWGKREEKEEKRREEKKRRTEAWMMERESTCLWVGIGWDPLQAATNNEGKKRATMSCLFHGAPLDFNRLFFIHNMAHLPLFDLGQAQLWPRPSWPCPSSYSLFWLLLTFSTTVEGKSEVKVGVNEQWTTNAGWVDQSASSRVGPWWQVLLGCVGVVKSFSSVGF